MKRLLFFFTPLFLLLSACGDRIPTAPNGDAMDTRPQASVVTKIKPGQGGPYEVGFTTFMVFDESRGDRPIPVYVWYPADPAAISEASPEAMYPLYPFDGAGPIAPSSAFEAHGLDGAFQEPTPAAGPFPLIMFSPGWQGAAYSDGLYIGTSLAKKGFIVAAVTHWGDQATANPAEPFHHLGVAAFDRPRDISRALDALLLMNSDAGALLFEMIHPAMIVASGWSLGGYASMVLAGGDDEVCDLADVFPGWPIPAGLCVPSHPDPRISMIIPLDGSNQLLHFSELARIRVPVMGIGQEWTTVGAWQARQHAAFAGHPAYRVDVFGAAHMSFSAICIGFAVMGEYGAMPAALADFLVATYCPPGSIDPTEARRIVLKYMLAFLTHDQPVLTPGHAITSEPNVEFFVSERRNPHSIADDWPGWYVYHIHQPGKDQAQAFKDLVATAAADPMGVRPLDFAYRFLSTGAR